MTPKVLARLGMVVPLCAERRASMLAQSEALSLEAQVFVEQWLVSAEPIRPTAVRTRSPDAESVEPLALPQAKVRRPPQVVYSAQSISGQQPCAVKVNRSYSLQVALQPPPSVEEWLLLA